MRLKAPEVQTLEQFSARIDAAARIDNQVKAVEAERDRRIHDIQEPANARIKELKAEMTEHLAAAESYALKHRQTLLGKRKSSQTKLAVWGFRQQTGLAMSDKVNDDEAIELLEEQGFDDLLARSVRLDKAAIRKALKEHAFDPLYALVHTLFSLRQRDVFFVEAKTDLAEPKSR